VQKLKVFLLLWLSILLSGSVGTVSAGEGSERVSLWIDVYHGEPVPYEDVLDDLTGVRVVYLGECHRLKRHHEIQARVLRDLARKGVPLVLGLEQLEHFQQPHLDRYNKRKIDFQELAKATDWSKRWHNYSQYRTILETARKFQIPILALNARAETIRQVARSGGVSRLDSQTRKELPRDLQLEDPPYETLLNLQLMVHMSTTSETLRPMREAQICRDEMMAAVLSAFLQSEEGRNRTAVVLCGAGHISYGLGTVSRVRRRLPDVKDRTIVLSQSGDLELSPEEKAMAREVQITHEQLRAINRPIADYLHVRSLRKKDGRE
jgi:uncharacterized iron-regulated protein